LLLDGQAPSGVELPLREVRRSVGGPHRLGDGGEFEEELHRGQAAADDEGALPDEVLFPHVVLRVELTAAEVLDARDVRDERVVPRAGGVEDEVGGEDAVVDKRDGERGPGVDAADRGGAQDLHVEGVLVGAVVVGDEAGGGDLRVRAVHGQAGEVGDAVGLTEGEGVPAVPPRAAGAVVGVEGEDVAVGSQRVSAAVEFVGGRQASLAGADDDGAVMHGPSIAKEYDMSTIGLP